MRIEDDDMCRGCAEAKDKNDEHWHTQDDLTGDKKGQIWRNPIFREEKGKA